MFPDGTVWGMNTELFSETGASQWVGSIHRSEVELIPWGIINDVAMTTVNRYLEALAIRGLHGPMIVRAGLVNVEGLSLAHDDHDSTAPVFGESVIIVRGPLRREHYAFAEFLDLMDPYESGRHILQPWSEGIALDAVMGRQLKILRL